MKKFLLILCIPIFLSGNLYAVDQNTERSNCDIQELTINEGVDVFDAPVFKKEKFKKKDSKIRKFFKKLNPFKKRQSDFVHYFIAFFLGLLLGLIGILIAFLIYLKHESRKRIMSFAWLGWLWWLVILSLILI